MPTPMTARLARALTVKNLESIEVRPISKQAAALAARTTRSPFATNHLRCACFGRACVTQADLRAITFARGELYHPLRFVLRRHPAVRRELIDEAWQILAQSGKQVAVIHPRLF
jgi:hypothetical protein